MVNHKLLIKKYDQFFDRIHRRILSSPPTIADIYADSTASNESESEPPCKRCRQADIKQIEEEVRQYLFDAEFYVDKFKELFEALPLTAPQDKSRDDADAENESTKAS